MILKYKPTGVDPVAIATVLGAPVAVTPPAGVNVLVEVSDKIAPEDVDAVMADFGWVPDATPEPIHAQPRISEDVTVIVGEKTDGKAGG